VKYRVTTAGKTYAVDVQPDKVVVDSQEHVVNLRGPSLLVDGRSFEIAAAEGEVQIDGESYAVEVERDLGLPASQTTITRAGANQLKAPIPGLVITVHVSVGDQVEEGQSLVVLEAMKMQMELKSPRTGRVSELHVKPGREVNHGQLLAIIGD
jgi:biotin carboxyl carrier protein